MTSKKIEYYWEIIAHKPIQGSSQYLKLSCNVKAVDFKGALASFTIATGIAAADKDITSIRRGGMVH